MFCKFLFLLLYSARTRSRAREPRKSYCRKMHITNEGTGTGERTGRETNRKKNGEEWGFGEEREGAINRKMRVISVGEGVRGRGFFFVVGFLLKRPHSMPNLCAPKGLPPYEKHNRALFERNPTYRPTSFQRKTEHNSRSAKELKGGGRKFREKARK